MSLDTPAYVTPPSHVANGVNVKAGTNWDLSRGAVATPIVALPDPEPIRPVITEPAKPASAYQAGEVPAGPAAAVTAFSKGFAHLDTDARAALRKLEKGVPYVVIGNADSSEKNPELLARQRANAVAAQMKRQGFKVVSVKSFGARRPLPTIQGSNSARVDVFVRD